MDQVEPTTATKRVLCTRKGKGTDKGTIESRMSASFVDWEGLSSTGAALPNYKPRAIKRIQGELASLFINRYKSLGFPSFTGGGFVAPLDCLLGIVAICWPYCVAHEYGRVVTHRQLLI